MHPLPPEMLSQVFIISHNKKDYETAYAICVDGLFYFITVAHLFQKISSEENKVIYIVQDNDWLKINASIFIPDDSLDLAIIKTNIPTDDNEPTVILSSEGLTLGQDLYFLGFPYYEFIGYLCEKKNNNRPIPLVKKAALSSIQLPMFFLDGYSNKGLSGGPLIFWDELKNQYKVCGIMRGYMIQKLEVKLEGEVEKVGNTEILEKLCYHANSGIAVAYDISTVNQAIELVRKKSN